MEGNVVHFIFVILFANADLFSINIYYIIKALSLNYLCTIHTHTIYQVKRGNLSSFHAGVLLPFSLVTSKSSDRI